VSAPIKLSEIDKTLLRYADSKSPQELSFLVNGALTAEECAARVASLLESPDWLSLTQQDALVTMRMRLLIAEMEEMPRTTRNAEVLLRGLEVLGNRLEKRSSGIESDLKRLYAWQGELLVEAVTVMIDYLKPRIPDLILEDGSFDDDEWNVAVENAIRRAGAVIGAHDGSAQLSISV